MCEVRDHRNMQKWIQQFIVLAIPIATLSLCLFFLTRQRHPLVWCVCMFVCGFVCEFGCRYVAREWPYWKKVILKQTETNWTTWIKKREKYYRISRKSREKCFGRERQHLACIVRTNKLSVCQQHTYYRRLMCVWFSVDLQMKKNIQFENCCRCTREKRIESQCSICFFLLQSGNWNKDRVCCVHPMIYKCIKFAMASQAFSWWKKSLVQIITHFQHFNWN